VSRPSYPVISSCPGSDLVGQASAALAASSIVFKTADPNYSAELLAQAQSLFTFAATQTGEQVTVTNEPYNGQVAAGGTVTVGFNGSYSASDAFPASVTCTS
jgi:glycosyl hydrolase family 9/cellulose binding protein with CBM2 domain